MFFYFLEKYQYNLNYIKPVLAVFNDMKSYNYNYNSIYLIVKIIILDFSYYLLLISYCKSRYSHVGSF